MKVKALKANEFQDGMFVLSVIDLSTQKGIWNSLNMHRNLNIIKEVLYSDSKFKEYNICRFGYDSLGPLGTGKTMTENYFTGSHVLMVQGYYPIPKALVKDTDISLNHSFVPKSKSKEKRSQPTLAIAKLCAKWYKQGMADDFLCACSICCRSIQVRTKKGVVQSQLAVILEVYDMDGEFKLSHFSNRFEWM
ncbi:hypothetical protein Tco_1172754 [Tanacetum coccineum]